MHYEKFADGSVKCIEDEIPFELPDGWAWARISSICVINPKNDLNDDTEVSFIPMPHIVKDMKIAILLIFENGLKLKRVIVHDDYTMVIGGKESICKRKCLQDI